MVTAMAIDSTVNSQSYQGNGSAEIPYVVPFRYDDGAWLKVTVYIDDVPADLEAGIDFSLSGDGSLGEGAFTTAVAYDAATMIVVERATPPLQSLDSDAPKQAYASALEEQLDRLAMALQDSLHLAVELESRSLKFPFTEPPDYATQLPPARLRRDSAIYFDRESGEMKVIGLDEFAARLIYILGAQAVLPYRVQEITASRELTTFDSNCFLRANTATELTITLPATAGVFDGSFSCEVSRVGTGAVTFAAAPGVVIDGAGTRIFGLYSSVAIRCVGVNHWQIYGDLY